MKLIELILLKPVIMELKTKRFPVQMAYKLNVLLQEINNQNEFYRNQFTKIIEDFGQRDENGQLKYNEDGESILIQEGRVEECQSELIELENLEIEKPNIAFTLEELDLMELTVEQVGLFFPLINQ